MALAAVGEDAFRTAREGPSVGCPHMVSLGSGVHFEEAIWFSSLGTYVATSQDLCCGKQRVRPWSFVLKFLWLYSWWPRFAMYLFLI